MAPLMATPVAHAADDPAAPYYRPHQMVEIAPGRRLNLYCTGKGSPVVIFDYGWGGPPTAWKYIQPAIGRTTTACTYDRAGYGFSGPGPLPRDTAAIVDDLHALLVRAQLKPPYVFVGHSMAGLAGVMFADRYREELAGMVLVDPAFAHQNERFDAIPAIKEAFRKSSPDLTECIEVAKSGKLPQDRKRLEDCVDYDPHDDATTRAAKQQWDMRPSFWATLVSENASQDPATPGGDRDGRELDAARRPWGDLPLVVLTSSSKHYAGFGPLAPAMQKLWWQGHEELARRSTAGRNVEVPGSDHYIQLDHPATVIEAVEQVVAAAKARQASASGTKRTGP